MGFTGGVRSNATKEDVEKFMRELGQMVTSPGRVYFTGGASAVLLGWRGSTLDLDVKAAPEPTGFFSALPKLKKELGLNIELASPDDFVPALPGWEDRSMRIDQHGAVTFLHYDFYGQALSKAERLHGRDVLDLRNMIKDGLVKPAKLMELFLEVAPKLERYPAIDETELRSTLERIVRGDL